MAAQSRDFSELLTHVDSPALDFSLSPITGLTRAHWLAVADDWLLSVARFRSPAGARIDLPGRPSHNGQRSDGVEGFARTFLLAAFRSADQKGVRGPDPHGHLARYLEGMVAGTARPGADDTDSWPIIGEMGGPDAQSHVEAASIALGLHLTREATWNLLATDEQDRIGGWLRSSLWRRPSPNNWYLFSLTVASFLEGVGRADERTSFIIERGLRLIDEWYRGEGWYSDGELRAFDHYIGWALHSYPVMHAHLRADSALSLRLGDRLRQFLESFQATFDSNGAPMFFGRSMIYRTATVASIAMGEIAGVSPLSSGQSRRVMSANLAYFLKRGATRDGVLSMGWHGPYPPIVQRYSGPGSPFWASKGFAALMLPDGHPVWTETETVTGAETVDVARAVASAGLLIQRTSADGIARIHNHGSDNVRPTTPDAGAPDPLYGRFAYSTRTGPTPLHTPSDNDVHVKLNGVWSVRRKIHAAATGANWAASWHAPRFTVYAPEAASDTASDTAVILPSTSIQSVTAVCSRVEVRITRLHGLESGLPFRLSGWAVASSTPELVTTRLTERGVTVRSDDAGTGGRLTSQLQAVTGWQNAATRSGSYGTALGNWAIVPELLGTTSGEIFVALASLTGTPGPEPLSEMVTVQVAGSKVDISWHDGTSTTIDMDAIDWS
ncbi:hypothetical protein B7R22_17605 [Subtercola boreus]|uniref:DUF2264 domain-containing protein n=2 Tax=Subtercola boreus TaxID=120213 RepID=A0A3E0VQB3_9MICO|nr:hypothetical protein B7R22_17605 [Subtercola boreus]